VVANAPNPESLTNNQRTKNKNSSSATPPDGELNAGIMTKHWIDWCTLRGVKLTPVTIKRYAAKFRELLDAGFEPTLIGAACQAMAKDNVISKVALLDHYVTRAQTGPEKMPERVKDVRTNQEIRNEGVDATIDRAVALVVARGGNPNNNKLVVKAMKEIRQGLVNVGNVLTGAVQMELMGT
jgi:hypothetical protein